MGPRRQWTVALSAAALVLVLGGCGRGASDSASQLGAGTSSPTLGGPGPLPSDGSSADPSGISTGAGSGTASASGEASATTAATVPPYNRVVLAAGVRQYLHCRGTGSPTVVVIPGLAVTATTWTDLTGEVEALTRTCVYDRPGIGQSPPRSSPNEVVDAGVNARELATLLSTAHQPGPYVLVGQGYGTLVARALARQHPSLVRALLLGGEAPSADGVGLFWMEAGHRVGIAASTSAAGPAATSTPQTVVTTEPDDDPTTLVADLRGLVQDLRG